MTSEIRTEVSVHLNTSVFVMSRFTADRGKTSQRP